MIGLAIALLLLGLGLVLAEVMIPSFGLFTVLCCASFVGSVMAAFAHSTTAGVVFAAAVAVFVPLTVVAAFRFLSTSRFGRRILLRAPDTPQAVHAIYEDNTRLVGRQGTAVSPLRPAGTVDFEGERVAVVTEGDRIDPGRRVTVIAVEGNRIVVRPADPDPREED